MPEMSGVALEKFNAQFQRSNASPLAEVRAPALELDGSQVLCKYMATGASPADMSGAEFYAVLGFLKRQHGPKGEALEADLMKISRQKDKKLRLADWIAEHHGPPSSAQALMTAPSTPLHAAAPTMPRLNLSTALAMDEPAAVAAARPATSRPALNGSQMADIFGASPRASAAMPSGALTARPSTAPAPAPGAQAAPVADMSVAFASFVGGRDHIKMSGGEYHGLVSWLQSKGHGDIEDLLMKVRLLGDKKFHLVKYMKEKCADLMIIGAGARGPVTQEHYEMPAPAPMRVSGAEVMQMAPLQMPPMPPHQSMAHAQPMPAAPFYPPAASAAPPPEGMLDVLTKLENTVSRMEESFNFAIECMRDDMKQAKAQLAVLRASIAPPQPYY